GFVAHGYDAADPAGAARAAEREAELRAAALVLERELRLEVAVAAATADGLGDDAGRFLARRRDAAAVHHAYLARVRARAAGAADGDGQADLARLLRGHLAAE